MGNAPYIVNKNTGKIVVAGTAYDVEEYIRQYEAWLRGDKDQVTDLHIEE